jgi:hypothetical protein
MTRYIDVEFYEAVDPGDLTDDEKALLRIAQAQVELCREIGGKLTVKRGKSKLKVNAEGAWLHHAGAWHAVERVDEDES